MGSNDNYPFEFKDLGPEETAYMYKHFSKGYQNGYMRVGPKDYFFSNGFKEDAAGIYNMPVRSDDTFVVTFPKAGTTWTQELVWMVANDCDYEKSSSIILPERFPFIEMSLLLNSDRAKKEMRARCKGDQRLLNVLESVISPGSKVVADIPSPRFLKTHLPLSLLPPSLLDTAKVVYVARDPRDVCVSYYHHNQLFTFMGYTGDFKNFWDYFRKGMLDWAPFFSHVLEAWEQRNHPNMLFIFYEDMLKDLPATIRRVAKFLGKQMSDEQVAKLSDHLTFKNFKNNKAVNYEINKELGWFDGSASFVRKGVAGNWRDYFDEEMTAQAQRWIEDNLRGTDLKLPQEK